MPSDQQVHVIRQTNAQVIPLRTNLVDLVDSFTARYPNPRTRRAYDSHLWDLWTFAHRNHPRSVTEDDLIAWITHGDPANNTVRQRLSAVRVFFAWCLATGHIDADPSTQLGHLRKSFPRLYGRAQAPTAARYLTSDQAQALINACKDGTWTGSRDQLTVRLGLLGLRISEIANLTWSNIQDDQLRWIGKGNRQRSANPGPTLTALLARWQRQYERSIGRPVKPSDPILCKQPKGCPVDADRPELLWGQAANAEILRRHLIRRAQQADLGHVAPHDLRRSAASILHHATTNDGGHRFDLLDIQQVLGHADPATTMRSYIDHIDADTLKRAGEILD